MEESSDSVIFQLSHQFWGFESFSLNGCNEINPLLIPRKHISKKTRAFYWKNKDLGWNIFVKRRIIQFHILRILFLHDDIKFPFSPELPTRKNTLLCCTKYGNLKWGITRKYPWRRLQCCTRVNPLNDAKKAGGTRFVISNFLLRTHIYDQ